MTVMLLEETPKVLPLGKLREDHGFSYHWTSSGQKPHLTPKKGKRIDGKRSKYVPFRVLVYRRVPPHHPHLLLHHLHRRTLHLTSYKYTENPVPERSGSTSEELRGNPLHEPTETENKNK